MLPCVDYITVPKEGNGQDQNEDSFALYGPIQLSPGQVLTVATVSDGTSVGQFSRVWSKMVARACRDVLVNIYSTPDVRSLDEMYLERCITQTVLQARCRWHNWATRYRQYHANIPWYSRRGLSTGAFATVLGAVFLWDSERQVGSWMAVVVGDSCLFQIRGSEMPEAFPIRDVKSFDSYPNVVGSCHEVNRQSNIQRFTTGTIQLHDQFYLMTDAVSEWYLTKIDNTQHSVSGIQEVIGGFFGREGRDNIYCLRNCGSLRNDDATLIRVSY